MGCVLKWELSWLSLLHQQQLEAWVSNGRKNCDSFIHDWYCDTLQWQVWLLSANKEERMTFNCVIGHSLQWRHNGHDGVSSHRRLYCLCYRLFRRRSKETSKLRVTGPWGESTGDWWPMDLLKRPVTQKMSPFDDVIVYWRFYRIR